MLGIEWRGLYGLEAYIDIKGLLGTGSEEVQGLLTVFKMDGGV